VHFREIPFLRLYTPLCAGVIVAELMPHAVTIASIVAAIAVAVIIQRIIRKSYFSDVLFGMAIVIFFLATGYLLHITASERLSDLRREPQLLMVRISEYPGRKTNSWSFRAKIISSYVDGCQYTPYGSILLYFMADTLPTDWSPGDNLMVRLTPQPVENSGNPCEFNYLRYLAGQQIKHIGFFRDADIIKFYHGSHLSLRERSLVIAHKMIGVLETAGLEGEELGLVTALTLGDKNLLDKEQLTSFSRAGAMHIMAVSGLHAGMISLVLSSLLFFMRGRIKAVKALIIIIALWAFAFITGMSPSVMRATIMFTFMQAGSLMHRPGSGMNILLASAFILTAAHPAVLFEAGFQLSYLAMAFIIAFYEPLHSIIRPHNKITGYLWQLTALSLVAQAGTLPLSIRLFNIFPLLFLVTNIVVIPVTFVVLTLTFLIILCAPLPHLSAFLAMLLSRLSHITLSFTGVISSLDHGVIDNIGLTTPETLLLITSIAFLLTSLLRVRNITLKPFLVAASLFLICGTVKNINESRRDRVIVYNIRGRKLRVRQHGRQLLVTPVDGSIPAEIKKHAATRGLKIKIIEPG
jgi:competence protein ComEC